MPQPFEIARKKLEELENDPKYRKLSPSAEKKLRNQNLDDPKLHKKDGTMDKKWHEDADGNWHHPDFE